MSWKSLVKVKIGSAVQDWIIETTKSRDISEVIIEVAEYMDGMDIGLSDFEIQSITKNQTNIFVSYEDYYLN